MITTRIVFDHRGRTARGADGPLEVRVTIRSKSYYVATGVKCKKAEWNGYRISSKRPNADELQARLDVMLRRIEQEINKRLENGQPIDVADIRNEVWRDAESSAYEQGTPFLDWLQEQVDSLAIREGTRKHYKGLAKRIEEFGELKRWSDVTVEKIYKFDWWLHQREKSQSDADIKAGIPAKRISDAGVFKYHKCLKALLFRAERLGVLSRNPYSLLRGEFKRGDGIDKISYLTEQEMQDFIAVNPKRGTQMDVAHDLFIFQMFTGLAYTDMQNFKMSDYREDGGKWVNIGVRVKTGVPYVSQLLPPAVEVLKKYNYQIPQIDNSDYNRMLKALGMVAGIDKPLHSHMARHTFATWMLSQGVDVAHVSRMLGHTNTIQTERYAKVMATAIYDDFERVSSKFTNSKKTNPNEKDIDSCADSSDNDEL